MFLAIRIFPNPPGGGISPEAVSRDQVLNIRPALEKVKASFVSRTSAFPRKIQARPPAGLH